MKDILIFMLSTCGFVLSACTQIPGLEEATGGIPVREIVLRIKCELSAAFESADRSNWLASHPKFAWLRNWTAQVDLTLQVLDTATLAPGASLTTPLRNPAESFAVAGGVSLNGQAQRIQTISFALSLVELELWRRQQRTAELCAISDNVDLTGRLGLREWILEALSPVAVEGDDIPEYLFAGNHPKPGSTAVSIPKVAAVTETKPVESASVTETLCDEANFTKHLETTETNLANAATTLGDANAKIKEEQAKLQDAKSKFQKFNDSQSTFKRYLNDNTNFDAVMNPDIKRAQAETSRLFKRSEPVQRQISTRFKETEAANDAPRQAISKTEKQIDLATRYVGIADRKEPKSACLAETASAGALQASQDSLTLAGIALATAKSAEDGVHSFELFMKSMENYIGGLKTIEPPISTIGQSVQFVLAYGGNFTPTWTFVRFKGFNNPLFSAASTRTHLLNITLGPVQQGTSNTPVAAVTQNQLYLLLNSVLPTVVRSN
jgi:hypothetical protein